MIRQHRVIVASSLIGALILSACQTQEQTGQLFGLGAGLLCAAVVNPRDRAACLAVAAVGFIVGGEIGRRLDARDRQRRQQAVTAALANDALWQSRQGPQPLTPMQVNTRPIDPIPPTAPPATAPSGWVNPDNDVEWKNPDTQNSDRIEPLSEYTANGTECRQFRETYYQQQQQPYPETFIFCKDAQGVWQQRSA